MNLSTMGDSWRTCQMSYLRKPYLNPWEAVPTQFGANNARLRDLKKNFLIHLADVLRAYPAARTTSRFVHLAPPYVAARITSRRRQVTKAPIRDHESKGPGSYSDRQTG